jgi:hypothetical protein
MTKKDRNAEMQDRIYRALHRPMSIVALVLQHLTHVVGALKFCLYVDHFSSLVAR